MNVGVILSGGQAPGGHNVISGIFDGIKSLNKDSKLYGFILGPGGLVDHNYMELTSDIIDEYRNTGGFDIIGSGRTKLEKEDQFEKGLEILKQLDIKALVIIGGDDSNTNACVLAEYYCNDPITFPWINHAMHRDHRKIVVIDGKIGYTGGMNIADYYITGLPKIGQWHDMHMRIEGDAVRYLQGIFLTMWNQETKQHVGGPVYFPDISQLPDSIAEEIAIVDRTPRETPRSISHAYAASIGAAQHSIQIVNPYFVPTKSIRKAIKYALKKGTEVEIMIPAVSDIPFTPEASFYIVHKLMKKGAKVYLFNGGFHHSKIMMVDRNFCTVGTANLNSRSLRYDFETNAFIFDPTITHQLNDMFERDKKNSTLLTPEVWKKRSGWKKFVGWVGNLMTPFL